MAAHKIFTIFEVLRPRRTPCTQALRGRRDGLDMRLFKYMKFRQNLMIQVMIDSIIQSTRRRPEVHTFAWKIAQCIAPMGVNDMRDL